MNSISITRKKKYPVLVAALALLVILAACTPGQVDSTAGTLAASVPTLAAQAPTLAAQAPTLASELATQVATSIPVTGSLADDSAELRLSQSADLGSFLVDEAGMTLYYFTKDEPGKTNCSGECLVNWPPLLTEKEPKADDGVDQSKLGTIPFEGNSLLVTYDGWPLYYFIGDQKPGDTTGQDVGGVWFVMPPAGLGSATAPAASSTAVSSGGGRVYDDSAELRVSQTAELGSFLVDDAGYTLYIFTKDTPGVSNCSGQCLVNWPPLLTEKAPKADDGVSQSKLGTIKLADGTLQVTYDGMPLYYYIKDLKPGDVSGQNVGSVWFVQAP